MWMIYLKVKTVYRRAEQWSIGWWMLALFPARAEWMSRSVPAVVGRNISDGSLHTDPKFSGLSPTG
jgi:hypothetical protein